MSRSNANPRGNTVDGSASGSPEVARNARVAHRGVCVFPCQPARLSPPFEKRGRVDCPDLPLHQQADLAKEGRKKSKKSADLPPTRRDASEAKSDLKEEGGSRQPRSCGWRGRRSACRHHSFEIIEQGRRQMVEVRSPDVRSDLRNG